MSRVRDRRARLLGADLTDKVVVITGGSRGIGRATALAAAARGFRVVVGYASNRGGGERGRLRNRGQERQGHRGEMRCRQREPTSSRCSRRRTSSARSARSSTMPASSGRSVARRGHVGRAHPAHDGGQRHRQHSVRARGGEADVDRAMAARAASSSICRRSPRSSARPTPMSIMPPPRARSIPSRSVSAMKSPAKAFASRRSGPG